jgi:hypothetical protein
LLNGGVSHYWGNAADYSLCFFCLALRGLEKEQEGLVMDKIEEILKRITCLEVEVAELKRKQWVVSPITEKIEVVGGYYQPGQPVTVNTTGAGIE